MVNLQPHHIFHEDTIDDDRPDDAGPNPPSSSPGDAAAPPAPPSSLPRSRPIDRLSLLHTVVATDIRQWRPISVRDRAHLSAGAPVQVAD